MECPVALNTLEKRNDSQQEKKNNDDFENARVVPATLHLNVSEHGKGLLY
jgi:hypothetical protein